ncbi:AraC family transcriptional regulator [Cohnella herbarum]|uniref:AraC family transcriptional regulator n=1 Tax=Cohnella herbarum TaxID=2728023 RepID=A0A7Z2VJP5_9BACL|nr:AraC family transcriptional regulator [Cohnella herbarum]QJD84220.1 AraC family transcriptional regulator [Cohnella herbarum]
MLPFQLVELPDTRQSLPLYAYSVGRHHQYYHSRPDGFPAYQIFLIKSGQGLFCDLKNGEQYPLSAGQAFAFPPDHPHEYYPISHEPWHIGFVGFRGPLAGPILDQIGMFRPTLLQPELFDLCWEEIGGIWQQSNESNPQRLFDLSVKLYALIVRLQDQPPIIDADVRPRADEVRNEALRKALLLINQHFTEPLLISNVAKAVGYSSQHFQRLFLQHFSITPHRYLQNLRMEKAEQLLNEDDSLKIQDIARQVGMETNYFVRVFRKTYGQPPGTRRESRGV